MHNYSVEQLMFYDGRYHSIDKNRISEFETRSSTDRFYSGRDVDVVKVVEEIGPVGIHFSNCQP